MYWYIFVKKCFNPLWLENPLVTAEDVFSLIASDHSNKENKVLRNDFERNDDDDRENLCSYYWQCMYHDKKGFFGHVMGFW